MKDSSFHRCDQHVVQKGDLRQMHIGHPIVEAPAELPIAINVIACELVHKVSFLVAPCVISSRTAASAHYSAFVEPYSDDRWFSAVFLACDSLKIFCRSADSSSAAVFGLQLL
jgi:hypothetical protein